MWQFILSGFVVLLSYASASTNAQAEQVGCWLSVDEQRKGVLWDNADPAVILSQSYYERAFGIPGLEFAACPGLVTLRQLTPELSDAERAPFCLVYDGEKGTYSGYEIGVRDSYFGCVKPTRSYCQVVNDSKDAAVRLAEVAAATAAASGGATVATSTAGLTVVTHSSGALILTGSGGYIAGTLGTVGTSVISVLTLPLILGAAAVTVVVAGGSVYVCNE